MLTKLKVENFKNFERAEVDIGAFTVLVGTNASGKSNLRDAFRFLHGIGRGYSLADILGEVTNESGQAVWKGIRGGLREISYAGAPTFRVEIQLKIANYSAPQDVHYAIEVDVARSRPRVSRESLSVGAGTLYNAPAIGAPLGQREEDAISANYGSRPAPTFQFLASKPLLTQVLHDKVAVDQGNPTGIGGWADLVVRRLRSIRFIDLSPDAMRLPSLPGQELGERGEHLSSVLQEIFSKDRGRSDFLEWIQELTPHDIVDFRFEADQIGRVLAILIESGGREISAYSASDGTLRFLALLAALFGPRRAHFYFFEELENGIHPTRLHLLVDAIQRSSAGRTLQVMATSHSPQLLQFLSEESKQHASLVYRLEDQKAAHITRIFDIPRARELTDIGSLHASGWFEDAMSFLEGQPEGVSQ